MSNWGKGHENNSIGWGQGGINNFIGWANAYDRSNSGQTVLNPSVSPSQLFLERVINDLGTFEAQQCLDALINQGLFDNANFVLTPNGYKAGKLYALKPENGDLDVTWVRNGNATRVNQNGLIENVGNNVPRIDFLGGNCPEILVEEQRTNLIENSNSLGPLLSSNIQLNYGISPEGIQNSFLLEFGTGVNDGVRLLNNSYQTLNDSFQTFALSFWARSVTGSSSNTFNIRIDSPSQPVIFTEDVIVNSDWKRYEFTFNSNGITINSRFRNVQSIAGKKIEYYGVQLEEALSVSSNITTVGSRVTRPSDAPQPITVPSGTIEIVEALEDGTFNTITAIPTTYTIPFGRFKYILFNGA